MFVQEGNLEQGSAISPCEGPESRYLWATGSQPQLFIFPIEAPKQHRQHVNKWTCLCSNKLSLWTPNVNFTKFSCFTEHRSCPDWVAQLVGALCPIPKAAGSISDQDTYLGCRFDHTSWGLYRRQPINVSFSHPYFFLSAFLFKINKHTLG